MTNFECERCGKLYMNLKTSREIELEAHIKELEEEYRIQKTKIQQRYEDLLGFDISELEDLSQEDKNILDNSTIKSLFNENKKLERKLEIAKETLIGIEAQNGSCWCKFCKDNIRKALQKMEEIDGTR